MISRLQTPGKFEIKDSRETVDRLTRFIRTQVAQAHADGVVMGLSGGLDSSVTAALSSLAIGGRRVLGLSMPENETYNPTNIRDARNVCKKYGISFRIIDITSIQEAARETLFPLPILKNKVAWGNLKARTRALILYSHANMSNRLVVGTGDKSELSLGYFTKFGDGACDIDPLADIYKTSVRELARHLGLSARIYNKTASPELWPGQTATQELGLDYSIIDQILWGLERWLNEKEIASELSLPVSLVTRVKRRWLWSEHKRRPPLTSKLGFRTVGMDLRLPYSIG